MDIVKIRSYYFIFDHDVVVGKTKTKAQAKRFVENYDKFNRIDDAEASVQKLIDFAGSIEDEMGYEFESKEEVLRFLQKFYPEIYDIDVNITRRMFDKIYMSGDMWHAILTFCEDRVYSTWDDLRAMTDFMFECENYGLSIENYRQVFRMTVPYKGYMQTKNVMPIGFAEGKVIIQLADGKHKWLTSPTEVCKRIA